MEGSSRHYLLFQSMTPRPEVPPKPTGFSDPDLEGIYRHFLLKVGSENGDAYDTYALGIASDNPGAKNALLMKKKRELLERSLQGTAKLILDYFGKPENVFYTGIYKEVSDVLGLSEHGSIEANQYWVNQRPSLSAADRRTLFASQQSAIKSIYTTYRNEIKLGLRQIKKEREHETKKRLPDDQYGKKWIWSKPMTQTALAQKLGITTPTLRKRLKSDPRHQKAIKKIDRKFSIMIGQIPHLKDNGPTMDEVHKKKPAQISRKYRESE